MKGHPARIASPAGLHDYVNPNFASDFRSAGSLMVRGAYHYARPGGVTFPRIAADATAEADFFIQVTGTMGGDGHPAASSELRNSRAFRSQPLWLASYGVARPVLPGGWKRYTFWQHTDRARLAGAGRRLDLSVFNGSLAQLHALTVKTSVASRPRGAVGALGASISHERARRSVASQASRAHATRMESTRFTWVTKRYLTRLLDPGEESRRRIWSDVLDRGGIRWIGR